MADLVKCDGFVPRDFIKNVLIQRFKFFKLGYPTQKQTREMPKIAPSNPLLLKGGRGALLPSYKLAKNPYFSLLRVSDIKGFKGINLGKKESKTKLLPRHKHLTQLHNNY